ncbi:hypothetical protein C8J56DRAFT_1080883 [Mycena floridula]|nr:hypothetical protein C8J56DRAFT_1080883 [Mycena floridula]
MSANDSAANVLPNPMTSLAFVSPELGRQIEIGRYIVVGGLSVMLWDVLYNITADYQLLHKSRRGFVTLIYFLSRIFTLYYVLMCAIFETFPGKHCAFILRMTAWSYPLMASFTSFLFFIRVKAVYSNRISVAIPFFCLWLAVAGSSITIIFGVTGGNIGPTPYCVNTSAAPYVSAAMWSTMVHDTAVTLAISIRLLHNSYADTDSFGIRTRAEHIFYGKSLPRFSRTIFQDGLVYYWITVAANILVTIMLYIPNIPPSYRTMFSIPTMALSNIMACYVFRHAKLGLLRSGNAMSGVDSTVRPSVRGINTMIPLSHMQNSTTAGSKGVVVSTTVESEYDWDNTKSSAPANARSQFA